MILTKRERLIGVAAVGVICVMLLDHFAITPWLNSRTAQSAERARILTEISRLRDLERRQRELAPRWQAFLASGLSTDTAAAESAALNAVRLWAEGSALELSSLRPEGSVPRADMQELVFQVSGTGPMQSVASFLWKVESAELPVRVRDLQLASRKEGTDDLTLNVRIAVLCAVSPPAKGAKAKKAAPATEEEGE